MYSFRYITTVYNILRWLDSAFYYLYNLIVIVNYFVVQSKTDVTSLSNDRKIVRNISDSNL